MKRIARRLPNWHDTAIAFTGAGCLWLAVYAVQRDRYGMTPMAAARPICVGVPCQDAPFQLAEIFRRVKQ